MSRWFHHKRHRPLTLFALVSVRKFAIISLPCRRFFHLGFSVFIRRGAFNIEAWDSVCYKAVPPLGYTLSLLHRNAQKWRPCEDFRDGER